MMLAHMSTELKPHTTYARNRQTPSQRDLLDMLKLMVIVFNAAPVDPMAAFITIERARAMIEAASVKR
jgi:hypothetical protein